MQESSFRCINAGWGFYLKFIVFAGDLSVKSTIALLGKSGYNETDRTKRCGFCIEMKLQGDMFVPTKNRRVCADVF